MKVLVFTSEYPPQGNTSAIHFFTREWAKAGHKVFVVFGCNRLVFPLYLIAGQKDRRTSAGRTERYEYEGVHVLKLPVVRLIPKSRLISRISRLRAIRKMKKAIEAWGQFDVIVSHFCSNQLFLVDAAQKTLKCPVVSIFHTCDTQDDRLSKAIVAHSDLVGARSAKIEDYLKQKIGYKQRIIRVVSGVPQQYLKGTIERSSAQKHKFIFVGKLIARKHVSEMIDAFAKMPIHYNYQLEIVGDGLEKSKLEAKVNKLKLSDKVVFTGRISRDEVAARMREADCFVMTSSNETFGLVYLEAMAAGCLVIGSRGEGIDGIVIDGENGFLVNPGDSDELYEKLIRIMDMGDDEYRRLTDNSYQTVSDLTDENVAMRYLEDIKTVLPNSDRTIFNME